MVPGCLAVPGLTGLGLPGLKVKNALPDLFSKQLLAGSAPESDWAAYCRGPCSVEEAPVEPDRRCRLVPGGMHLSIGLAGEGTAPAPHRAQPATRHRWLPLRVLGCPNSSADLALG